MSDPARKRASRLGRGLSSLMSTPVQVQSPSPPPDEPVADTGRTPQAAQADASAEPGDGLRHLPIDALSPNPYQPRQRFDDASIDSLAASIRADGVMQPIVARPMKSPGRYEIVAGERRWRAARVAGLDAIPALVRPLDDRQSAEWALIENLQREDLNPIDRAEAFKRLCEQHSLSHDQVAQRVGLERSTISNLLRLLNLSGEVRDLVRQDLLSMGHARAIAGLSDPAAQAALAARAIREGLSVRAVERLASGGASTPGSTGPRSNGRGKSAYLRDLETQLGEQLGTKVELATGRKKGAGKLTINFYSLDQFDAILAKLGVEVR